MKHKTWFRLVTRALGVLLVGLSLPGTVTTAVAFLTSLLEQVNPAYSNIQTFNFNWPYYVGASLQFLFGIYLFFGGNWIVNRCIPSNRPYCPDCGFDLSKATGTQCPECGIMLPQRDTPRTTPSNHHTDEPR
jgi:hypothetical protein